MMIPNSDRRLREAMDKLEKHHPQIAGRLRTLWKREDDAWVQGNSPLTDHERDAIFEAVEPSEPRTPWQQFVDYWKR